jgi:hypothetical protein
MRFPVRHDLTDTCHHRIGIDDVLGGLATIIKIGSCKRAGCSKLALASFRSKRKARYAWLRCTLAAFFDPCAAAGNVAMTIRP